MAIYQTSAELDFLYKNFSSLKKWLKQIIESENFYLGEVTIVFTSDEYLLNINNMFLKHDFYTDVLTFDYTVDNTVNGDILISIDRVKENAIKYKVDFISELDRIILHGVLHLIGYRDSTEEEINRMRSRESFYLEKR